MRIAHTAAANKTAVHKFGGSSVATAERIHNVASIIAEHTNPNDIIVVSANGSMTDWLEAFAQGNADILLQIAQYFEQLATSTLQNPQAILTFFRSTLKQLKNIHYSNGSGSLSTDEILAFGEVWSANLLAELLNQKSIPAGFVDARKLLSTHNIENFQDFDLTYFTNGLNKLTQDDAVQRLVVTGFIANNAQGKTTTLGRNGSDYTASLVARFSQAQHVTLWTDVPGIYTADPRLIPAARPIKQLCYEEAGALASIGTNVLHQKTISPLIDLNIPLFVRSSLQPTYSGTQVQTLSKTTKTILNNATDQAKSVALKQELVKIELFSISDAALLKLRQELLEQHINILIVDRCQKTNTCTLLTSTASAQKALQLINDHTTAYQTDSATKALIAIVGKDLQTDATLLLKISSALTPLTGYHIAQQENPHTLTLITNNTDAKLALTAIYAACFSAPLQANDEELIIVKSQPSYAEIT